MISSNVSKRTYKIYKQILSDWQLYLIFLPVLIYFIVYKYVPMYGVQLAFKKFSNRLGILGSPWVGFDNFKRFLSGVTFPMVIKNTVGINLYSLLVGFPTPILLALMLNEVTNMKFKKVTQTVTYAPHFISTVVMCGMITLFLSPTTGFINKIIELLGGEAVQFMYEEEYFKTIYVFSGVWQSTGWGSIIYLSALSSVSSELHEAATIDGATILQKILHINLPFLLPTISIMLIMQCGSIMNVGFEKVYLLMNDLNRSSAEVISTYTYKVGLIQSDFSYSTAIGLFNSCINLVFLMIVNKVTDKLSNTSLF